MWTRKFTNVFVLLIIMCSSVHKRCVCHAHVRDTSPKRSDMNLRKRDWIIGMTLGEVSSFACVAFVVVCGIRQRHFWKNTQDNGDVDIRPPRMYLSQISELIDNVHFYVSSTSPLFQRLRSSNSCFVWRLCQRDLGSLMGVKEELSGSSLRLATYSFEFTMKQKFFFFRWN